MYFDEHLYEIIQYLRHFSELFCCSYSLLKIDTMEKFQFKHDSEKFYTYDLRNVMLDYNSSMFLKIFKKFGFNMNFKYQGESVESFLYPYKISEFLQNFPLQVGKYYSGIVTSYFFHRWVTFRYHFLEKLFTVTFSQFSSLKKFIKKIK